MGKREGEEYLKDSDGMEYRKKGLDRVGERYRRVKTRKERKDFDEPEINHIPDHKW